jgi:hypothetical protein
MFWKKAFFTSLIVLAAESVPGLPERGVWCWAGLPGDDWDTTVFVGDPIREEAAIREFKRWNIKRIYGSYRNRVIDEPETIAAWNARLHDAGILSMLLLSENTWIFPEYRTHLLDIHVQQKLIGFNNARTNQAECFDGLHLDIEPHALPQWETGAGSEYSATNRMLVNLLRDTFLDTREYLNTNGAAAIPVYADLPFWIDSSNKIGWTDSTERDQWFVDAGSALAGITLMAYAHADYDFISRVVSWEFEHCPAEIRVGLEARIGPGNTWADFDAFIAMAEQVEADFGTPPGIDIHDLKGFEAHVPPTPPLIGTPAAEGTNIVVPVSGFYPGSSNWIQRSTSLRSDAWTNVAGFVSWNAATGCTDSAGFDRAFYRVISR